MTFLSYCSTVSTDTSNLLTIKLTSMLKIVFVKIIAPTDSFKILIIRRYLFFSIIFFVIIISTSYIAILKLVKGITMNEVGARLSLTSFYLPK